MIHVCCWLGMQKNLSWKCFRTAFRHYDFLSTSASQQAWRMCKCYHLLLSAADIWSQACNIWEYLLRKPFPRNEVFRIVFCGHETQLWLDSRLTKCFAHGSWLTSARVWLMKWPNLLYLFYSSQFTVILLPLRPASLTHENFQGWKIIDSLRPLGGYDRLRSIDRSKDVFWRMHYLCDFKYELKASPTQKSS